METSHGAARRGVIQRHVLSPPEIAHVWACPSGLCVCAYVCVCLRSCQVLRGLYLSRRGEPKTSSKGPGTRQQPAGQRHIESTFSAEEFSLLPPLPPPVLGQPLHTASDALNLILSLMHNTFPAAFVLAQPNGGLNLCPDFARFDCSAAPPASAPAAAPPALARSNIYDAHCRFQLHLFKDSARLALTCCSHCNYFSNATTTAEAVAWPKFNPIPLPP